ncbi:hypothetical protein NKJ45_31550, partial [Mesorhizobium sp. M0103]
MSIHNPTHPNGPVGRDASISTRELVAAAADEVWRPYFYHQTFDGADAAEIIAEDGQQLRVHSSDALCCGTFGELLQGQLPVGCVPRDPHFLVTMPIALFARAHFIPIAGTRSVTV